MDRIESPDRRNFLQGAVVASGAILLGFYILSASSRALPRPSDPGPDRCPVIVRRPVPKFETPRQARVSGRWLRFMRACHF